MCGIGKVRCEVTHGQGKQTVYMNAYAYVDNEDWFLGTLIYSMLQADFGQVSRSSLEMTLRKWQKALDFNSSLHISNYNNEN